MTTRNPALLSHVRGWHEAAPMLSAVAGYGVLAAVRLAGAFTVPCTVLSILLTPSVLLAVPRGSWTAVGLRPARKLPTALGIGVVLLAYADVVACNWAAFGTTVGNWTMGIPALFRTMVPGNEVLLWGFLVLAMGLFVPLVEEICYRGVLFTAVARRAGTAVAVVVTSLGWAFVHLGNYGLSPFAPAVIAGVLPSVFCMGMALGYCRVLTGSVFACAAAQGIANLALVTWVTMAARL